MEGSTVLITGAGFTKAFVEDAPLLEDDWSDMLEPFKNEKQFPTVSKIISDAATTGNKVNLEKIFTRVDAGMPYDRPDIEAELKLASYKLKWGLKEKFENFHDKEVKNDELNTLMDKDEMEIHLESEPFIVPPLLAKTALVEQPILRMVWGLAFKTLQEAENIFFIGYSLPTTDLAAKFLFQEAIPKDKVSKIKVINYSVNEDQKIQIRSRFKTVFPSLTDEQFDFGGALEWSRQFVKEPIITKPQVLA